MANLIRRSFEITETAHIYQARREILEASRQLGFTEKELGEIAIVVTELAGNLIKHKAISGKIIFCPIEIDKKKGIEIVSEDQGPGIANTEAVLENGVSSAGTLGIGLGAVRRLMSDFEISSEISNKILPRPVGTRIVTRKFLFLDQKIEQFRNFSTHFSVFTRSKIGESVNGDAFFIKRYEDQVLVAVIDGLGHGQKAAEATQQAKLLLMNRYRMNFEELIKELHLELKHSRGIALSMARISDANRTLEYVGVGNVLTRIYNSPTPIKPVNYNGTLGVSLRKFKVFHYPWTVGNFIILTSDGISTRYHLDNFNLTSTPHPLLIAQTIFKQFAKTTDDATILVGGQS